MIWGWFLRVGPFYRDICQLVASLVCETLFKRLNLVPGTPLPLPPTTTAEAASKNLDVLRPSVQALASWIYRGTKTEAKRERVRLAAASLPPPELAQMALRPQARAVARGRRCLAAAAVLSFAAPLAAAHSLTQHFGGRSRLLQPALFVGGAVHDFTLARASTTSRSAAAPLSFACRPRPHRQVAASRPGSARLPAGASMLNTSCVPHLRQIRRRRPLGESERLLHERIPSWLSRGRAKLQRSPGAAAEGPRHAPAKAKTGESLCYSFHFTLPLHLRD